MITVNSSFHSSGDHGVTVGDQTENAPQNFKFPASQQRSQQEGASSTMSDFAILASLFFLIFKGFLEGGECYIHFNEISLIMDDENTLLQSISQEDFLAVPELS